MCGPLCRINLVKFTIDHVWPMGTSGRMTEWILPMIPKSGGLPHLEMGNLDPGSQEIEHGGPDARHQKRKPQSIREKSGR